MKLVKSFLIMLLMFHHCLLAATNKLNLLQYADLTSIHNKVDILISDEIDPNDFYFFTRNLNPTISLTLFKKMIELKGLRFVKKSDFYFVDEKKDINSTRQIKDEIINIYSVDLKNNSFRDIKKVFNTLDINSTYTKSNKIIFKTTKSKYDEIIKHIASLDIPLKQVKLKITIIETNINKMKDRSLELKSFLKSANSQLTQYMNLVTMPYSQSTNLIKFKSPRFYSVIRFLDSNDISDVKSSPLLTAKSNHKVFFSVVKNIPYLKQSKKVNDNKETEENSYEYKDVGLKVLLTPIVLDDSIDIDLHLVLEDVLSTGVTPIVSKKELKSSYSLKYNEVLVLSGLNKEIEFKDNFSIPILSKLWIFGDLFKFETSKKEKTTLSLILEVVK